MKIHNDNDIECARILLKMKYSKKKLIRKTFYLNGDKNCPIMAGGVLFYKYEENEIKVLVINKNNRYEDFGGKIDSKKDKNIIDTISREVAEESNNLFQNDYIIKKLKSSNPIYLKDSKYLLYVLELEKEYPEDDFSNREYHTNCFRNVELILFDNFITKLIHPRIGICKNKKFMKKLFI